MTSTNGDSGDGGTIASSSPGIVTLNIRHSNGAKTSVQANLDSTVREFKAVVAQNCEVPVDQQRLIYKGRILKDDQTLESYGLQQDHAVHMVRGLPAASSDRTDAANGGATNTTSGVVRSIDSTGLEFGLDTPVLPELGFNILGGTGVSDLFGTGFEQVQQQMNMSGIQSLMNPDITRSLIMSNPQMREIIDRNPDLAHILNDSSTLRQTMEAARNPELMREMTRNTDRAMSNIEASPEGFNMLRRMYETVQEPLLSASTIGGNSGNDAGSNQFAALLGNQANSPSTTGSETTSGSPASNTSPLPNPWSTAGAAGVWRSTIRPSTPASNARAPGVGGLDGLGILDMDPAFAGLQDTLLLEQSMQIAAVSRLLRSVLSNPQYMNQMISLYRMLGNPDFRHQLASPETMQQMLSLQQSLLSPRQQPSTQEPGQPGSGAVTGATNNVGSDFLMNMLGGLSLGDGGANVPPEERYATQLSQLREMGFVDTQENIRALSATAGNVRAAVERLLGNLGQ